MQNSICKSQCHMQIFEFFIFYFEKFAKDTSNSPNWIKIGVEYLIKMYYPVTQSKTRQRKQQCQYPPHPHKCQNDDRMAIVGAILLLFTRLSITRNTKVYISIESSFFALHDRIKTNLIALFSEKRFDRTLVRASFLHLSSESIQPKITLKKFFGPILKVLR